MNRRTDPNVGRPLRRPDMAKDPSEQFRRWYAEAEATEPVFPDAMTLATVGSDGRPHARVVLLKGLDDRGFVFFTNYESRKGRELEENPRAEIVFWWRGTQRQVRIEGEIERVMAEESEQYFATRPRGSQLSAWASRQSEVIDSRDVLETRMNDARLQYDGQDIPRPGYWGGYRVVPDRFEFWQGREDRLHDRFEYVREVDGSYAIRRLSP